MPLYDAHGRPVKTSELTREQATVSTTGVRRVYDDVIAESLTPERLATILREAKQGNTHSYLTLAEEIEEREPHYRSVLGQRKQGLGRLQITVEPASDDKRDQEIAEDVQRLVKRREFRGMLWDLADGLGKGYAVVEIMWKRGAKWEPESYEWRDPRFFTFDEATRKEIRLRDEQNLIEGVPLAPYKFIRHVPKLKSGLPLRGGLAFPAAALYMIKSYSLTDWLAFAEVFGMPVRVGKYERSAGDEDIRKLVNAVANIGTDAAGVIPKNMDIEFPRPHTIEGTGRLFSTLAGWADEQISKLVVGQTMTSEDGSSRAQAEVHDGVRVDILEADGLQCEGTLQRDLVQPYVDLNYGEQPHYPQIRLSIQRAEDVAALIQGVDKMTRLGLRVSQREIREKLGLREPENDEEILSPQGGGAPPPAPAMNAEQQALRRALNARGEGFTDALDELMGEALSDWEEAADPLLEPVRRAVEEATDFEDLERRLAEVLPDLDATEAIRRLMLATFKARGAGDATDAPDA